MECALVLAALAQLLRELGGILRNAREHLDAASKVDGAVVRGIGSGVIAEQVPRRRNESHRAGLLVDIAGLTELPLGALRKLERAGGVAARERDARELLVRDRRKAHVSRGGRPLAAGAREGFGLIEFALMGVDRRERQQHQKLETLVLDAPEQLERAAVIRDRGIKLTGVVEADGDAHQRSRDATEIGV